MSLWCVLVETRPIQFIAVITIQEHGFACPCNPSYCMPNIIHRIYDTVCVRARTLYVLIGKWQSAAHSYQMQARVHSTQKNKQKHSKHVFGACGCLCMRICVFFFQAASLEFFSISKWQRNVMQNKSYLTCTPAFGNDRLMTKCGCSFCILCGVYHSWNAFYGVS